MAKLPRFRAQTASENVIIDQEEVQTPLLDHLAELLHEASQTLDALKESPEAALHSNAYALCDEALQAAVDALEAAANALEEEARQDEAYSSDYPDLASALRDQEAQETPDLGASSVAVEKGGSLEFNTPEEEGSGILSPRHVMPKQVNVEGVQAQSTAPRPRTAVPTVMTPLPSRKAQVAQAAAATPETTPARRRLPFIRKPKN